MTVQVGQTLDKYELLERVGQGGMAIVYRGRDNSLRRDVAVKVLHQHLAEHKEARERFEREAQAVAKLRHENILEIYDFSGIDSSESYIVTEFIEGQSLKEFITDHSIRYPEIGAMITLEVCKALQHAHSQGILHRDVKPENVMIRSDGVVKLTDFGIAQMIDLQRLTLTGQLLGSPAYMSPEHVNGGQLDFRTDVFAIGIVLYQLITGELPFKGKNPHAILKRIAEGDYIDPQVVNPYVSKELGHIIAKSLARDKDDRFADVTTMLAALETFLDGSGLTSPREELARFFAAPVSYEMAIKARLVDHLVRLGREQLADEQPAALEALNRVLTMEPDNEDVLGLLDHLGRRRKRIQIAIVVAAVGLMAALLWGIKTVTARMAKSNPPLATAVGETREGSVNSRPTSIPKNTNTVTAETPENISDAAPLRLATDVADAATDAALDEGPSTDAEATDVNAKVVDAGRHRRADAVTPLEVADAAPPRIQLGTRNIVVSIFPPSGAEYRINGGPWASLNGQRRTLTVPQGTVRIEARNLSCCTNASVTVDEAVTSGRGFNIRLPYRDGMLVPRCNIEGVKVQIAGKPVSLNKGTAIRIPKDRIAAFKVRVLFYNANGYLREFSVAPRAGQSKDVTCPPL